MRVRLSVPLCYRYFYNSQTANTFNKLKMSEIGHCIWFNKTLHLSDHHIASAQWLPVAILVQKRHVGCLPDSKYIIRGEDSINYCLGMSPKKTMPTWGQFSLSKMAILVLRLLLSHRSTIASRKMPTLGWSRSHSKLSEWILWHGK